MKALDSLANRFGLFPVGNGTKAAAAGSGVDFVGAPNWRNVIRLDSAANPEADALTLAIAYATSALAFTAIDYRAKTLSEPPLLVERETEDGDEWERGHPLTPVLEAPSPDFDMGELLYLTESYRLTTGGALWVKVLDNAGRLARLIPFAAPQFGTEADPVEGLIYGRYWVQGRGGRRYYAPDEVVHFREINPGSWREGTNRLEVALASLDLGHQINKMVRTFAKNAIFNGGVISTHPEWDPDGEEWESYKSDIQAWLQGPQNAGKPLILQGGTTFSATASRMKDLLPDEIMDRIEATVASVFGVPPVVLGWLVGLRNSPWSQMSEARRMVYEDTVEPRWRDVERRLTRSLLQPEERARGLKIVFDTSDVRALFDDDQLRATVATTLRQEWTLNERRVYTGQDPLPDDDPRGEEIDGGGGGALGLLGQMGADAPGEVKARDDKGLEWVIFDGTCKAAERTWESEVAKGLTEWKAGILRLAHKHLAEEKEIRPETGPKFLDAVDDWLEKTGIPLMRTLVFPLVFSTAEKAVKQLTNRLSLSFAVFEPGLLTYAEREAEFLAEVMGETTGKKVAAVVQKGLAEGDLLRDMTKRLETDAAFARTRAKLVARTETTRAWNGAQRTGMSDYEKSSEAIVTKIWLSAQDDRVRDEHIDLDGTQLPVDDTFANGLTEPGEPNCRCTLLYQISDPLGDTP